MKSLHIIILHKSILECDILTMTVDFHVDKRLAVILMISSRYMPTISQVRLYKWNVHLLWNFSTFLIFPKWMSN